MSALAVTVMGTPDDDNITAVGQGPAEVDVVVNDGTVVTYAGLTSLLLSGKAGDGGDALADQLAVGARWSVPNFPLRGPDVLKLGVPHGPRVGELLSEVEAWWIGGDFAASREDCLARLKELI